MVNNCFWNNCYNFRWIWNGRSKIHISHTLNCSVYKVCRSVGYMSMKEIVDVPKRWHKPMMASWKVTEHVILYSNISFDHHNETKVGQKTALPHTIHWRIITFQLHWPMSAMHINPNFINFTLLYYSFCKSLEEQLDIWQIVLFSCQQLDEKTWSCSQQSITLN